MTLYSLLTQSATVSRLQQGVGLKSTYQVVEQSLACLIQPVTAEYAQVTGMVYGRTYNGYFKLGADIQINDRVTDQDGKVYGVTGSMKRNYGSFPHLTILLTEQPATGADQ